MKDETMLLQTHAITVERGNAPPLSFADLNVAAGETVLLLGPSGCGKTTLLSVIAGLLKPARGTVTWNGQDFYKADNAARDVLRGREFGFVFQTLHLLPSLTLYQNIALAADMAGLPQNKNRIDPILARLGLSDKTHKKPDALSQGEQQRAAVARAVLNAPKIILADEPTSALDDHNADAVITLLIEQARESNAALVVATHDARITKFFSKTIHLNEQSKVMA